MSSLWARRPHAGWLSLGSHREILCCLLSVSLWIAAPVNNKRHAAIHCPVISALSEETDWMAWMTRVAGKERRQEQHSRAWLSDLFDLWGWRETLWNMSWAQFCIAERCYFYRECGGWKKRDDGDSLRRKLLERVIAFLSRHICGRSNTLSSSSQRIQDCSLCRSWS